MARSKRDQSSDVSQYGESGGTMTDDEIVEYDESVVESTVLAQVEEADGDPNVTAVEEALFKARDAVEQSLGGFQAIMASAGAIEAQATTGLENIMGFGIGEKLVGGRVTGDLCVKVYVMEKMPLTQLSDEAIVPSEIDGYQTDVVSVGEIYAQSFRRRYRPAPGGSSIGHPNVTAGTHGCLVVLNNNRLCSLSNNHVLANSNDARVGDPIIQPGTVDGGRNPQDRVGSLESFVPIDFRGGPNKVDAAVAWTSFRNLSGKHHCYTINPNPIRPRLNMLVRKCGRTTQHTLGLITGVGVNIRVNYGTAGVAVFRNQLQIQGFGGDFSQGGDSGSLIVTAGTCQPAALLFAGGGGNTFANPIDAVIPAIGIRRFLAKP